MKGNTDAAQAKSRRSLLRGTLATGRGSNHQVQEDF